MKLAALLGLALCVAQPARASAQAPMTLALDGSPLTLASAPGRRLIVELRGDVTCTTDGLTLDALGHPRGGGEARGGLVHLPDGARALESELGRHVVELPEGESTLRFDGRALLGDRTVSRAQALWSLSGAIEVRVLNGAAAAPFVADVAGSAPLRWPLAAGGLLVLLFGGAALRRRSRATSLARAKRAAAAVRREARRLGPSFTPTIGHCAEVLRAAEAAQRHAETSEAALRRTRSLTAAGAVARRAALSAQLDAVYARIGALADRLEATAAQLAEHDAARARPQELEQQLRALEEDVQLGVRAELEAGLA